MISKQNMNKIKDILKSSFPHIDTLLEEQEYYIGEILKGKDIFAIMDTGKGKSICYQIPALLWEKEITIVISPLTSLTYDQLKGLNKDKKVATVFYSKPNVKSQMNTRKNYEDIIQGKYRLIYISPETLQTVNFWRVLRHIAHLVKMVVVDETHCASTWGHSFRPAYLEIPRLVNALPKRPVVAAFTATATNFIVSDVIRTLKLKVDNKIESKINVRENLKIEMVSLCELKSDEQTSKRNEMVVDDIKRNLKEQKKGVIFCIDKKSLSAVKELLLKEIKELDDMKVRVFHGDLDFNEKIENLNALTNGECKVMVCTAAFSMGVNIPDIEFVIHYQTPLSMINYYQEIGRGARDKKLTCECKLYHCKSDSDIAKQLISNGKRKEIAKARYKYMVNFARKYSSISDTNPEFSAQNIEERQSCVVSKIKKYYEKDNKKVFKDLNEEKQYKHGVTLYVNNTYVANELRKGNLRGKKHFVRYEISAIQQKQLGLSSKYSKEIFNYIDMMIADAVYSLWLTKSRISPQAIWELLSGDTNASLQKEKANEIRASLIRLNNLEINVESMDSNPEYVLCFSKEKKTNFSGKFLDFDEEELKKNRYVLKKIPPLYEYAEYREEFVVFPQELLNLNEDIPDNQNKPLPATIEMVILKYFLLKRIKTMNGGTQISFRSLFERLGIEMYPQKANRNENWDKYSYKRKYNSLCGVPELKKPKIKGKLEQILEILKNKGVLNGFQFTCCENEKIKGIVPKYTLLKLWKKKEE